MPGFSFIICRRDKLEASRGKARSLSLDLYDQWLTMEKDGKWRFTSPTHLSACLCIALKELEEEGGITARADRYRRNNHLLIEKMGELGIRPYIEENIRGRLSLPSFIRRTAASVFRICISI